MYTIRINTAAPEAMLQRIKAAMAPTAIDAVVERQAFSTQAELVKRTPKRFFGQVRRDWHVERLKPGAYRVVNLNKIMWWLEHGTGHSTGGFIYPKVAKALFVAITRRAAMAQATRGAASSNKLTYGVDYVLAKRVKGIVARHIVRGMRKLATQRLLEAMKAHLRRALKG